MLEFISMTREGKMMYIREHKKAVAIAIIALAGVCVLMYLFSILSGGTGKYYRVGNDKILTVGNALKEVRKSEEAKVWSEGNVDCGEFFYGDVVNVRGDVVSYMQYMRDNEGFRVVSGYNTNKVEQEVQMAKKSVDDGKIILLTISCKKDYYTIKIRVSKGTISTS